MVIQANPGENDEMAMTKLELMNMMPMKRKLMNIMPMNMMPMNMMLMNMMQIKTMLMNMMLMKIMLICQIMMQNFADLHRIDPGGSESVSGSPHPHSSSVVAINNIHHQNSSIDTSVEPL